MEEKEEKLEKKDKNQGGGEKRKRGEKREMTEEGKGEKGKRREGVIGKSKVKERKQIQTLIEVEARHHPVLADLVEHDHHAGEPQPGKLPGQKGPSRLTHSGVPRRYLPS